MLFRRRCGTYNFRRSVPSALRPWIGRTEFVGSLGTNVMTLARARAERLYSVPGIIFGAARMLSEKQQRQRLDGVSAVNDEFQAITGRHRRVFELEKQKIRLVGLRRDYIAAERTTGC